MANTEHKLTVAFDRDHFAFGDYSSATMKRVVQSIGDVRISSSASKESYGDVATQLLTKNRDFLGGLAYLMKRMKTVEDSLQWRHRIQALESTKASRKGAVALLKAYLIFVLPAKVLFGNRRGRNGFD